MYFLLLLFLKDFTVTVCIKELSGCDKTYQFVYTFGSLSVGMINSDFSM